MAIVGYEQVTAQSLQVTTGPTYQFRLECPEGKTPLGGGFALTDYGDTDIKVLQSSPEIYTSYRGWVLEIANPNENPLTVAIYMICADED